MFTSVQKVLDYLDDVDPEAARVARQRYGCLSPWEGDPQSYGWAAISGRYRDCESDAVSMLRDLMERRLEYTARDGRQFFDARRNAELVANAARYYRVMYYGDVQSWNLRDQHMFETVESLMQFYDRPDHQAKGVLWAHNSHLGDASATEMGKRGETNLGQLCREHYHDQAYLIGQGTDRGTVAAARGWDEPMETMTVRPAHESSFERLCHEAGQPRFFLPLRAPSDPELRAFLQPSRLQRAIGVVYRPQTELQSHYFHSRVPYQFDEWIWFDESSAVHPVTEQQARRHPPQHPFSLID
jgi:protein-L-isoaspartate(D-aspartate) O-methyltransferase